MSILAFNHHFFFFALYSYEPDFNSTAFCEMGKMIRHETNLKMSNLCFDLLDRYTPRHYLFTYVAPLGWMESGAWCDV